MPLVLCVLLLVSPRQEQTRPTVAEHVHGSGTCMEVSCSPSVSADFDRALALLHNFWYARALEAFQNVIRADPTRAMAYWGAALTYNHPFWDAPTRADLAAAWALVQRGQQASPQVPRERMYIEAVAALYSDAGAGPKSARDTAYFTETLKRTPGRPKAIYGIAQAADRAGDKRMALERYSEFLDLWKQADSDRPEPHWARQVVRTIRTGQ